MHPPEGPPICTALNSLPSGMPPPMSKTISRSVIPMGTSTSPVFTTLPVSAKTFVPLEFAVPMAAKDSAPSRMMWETFAMVSTLLTMVGFWKSPATDGNGGRGRGMPRRPSTEAMRAVSSPQTKAPAPS